MKDKQGTSLAKFTYDHEGKLYKIVVSRLQAWGASKLAFTVGVAVTYALNFLDIGTQIAKYIATHDRKPCSKDWIDF